MPDNNDTPFLHDDIIINILKRLPVKSLKRFQCVCKHWNTLIKTTSFIQHHLHHSTHHNTSLIVGPGYSYYSFCLFLLNSEMQFHEIEIPPYIDSHWDLTIEGSCNGLLCFVQWGINHADPLLCNPATREIKLLPKIFNYSSDGDESEAEAESFLFSSSHFGFGFSPVINDYKIVKIFRKIFEEKKSYAVGVYSLSKGCWRNIGCDNIKDVSFSDKSVTINGVVFWSGSTNVVGRHDKNVIVSFDLVTEVFTVIPYPAFPSHSNRLAVYDDKLAIIFYDETRNSLDFCLHFGVMEEGAIDSSKERWSSSEMYIVKSDCKLYFWAWTIWRNQLVTAHLGRSMSHCFRCEKIKDSTKRLYLIDVITHEYKRFDIPEFRHGHEVSVFNYVESLVPIGGDFQIEEP